MSTFQPNTGSEAIPVTDPNYQPLPGRLGNLNQAQLIALDKFKKELQDEGYFVPERMDDATLLRCATRRSHDMPFIGCRVTLPFSLLLLSNTNGSMQVPEGTKVRRGEGESDDYRLREVEAGIWRR